MRASVTLRSDTRLHMHALLEHMMLHILLKKGYTLPRHVATRLTCVCIYNERQQSFKILPASRNMWSLCIMEQYRPHEV